MNPVNRSTGDAHQADTVQVGIGRLSIEDVVRVARDGQRVSPLAPEVEARVQATAAWVANTVEQIALSRRHEGHKPAAYYGINTGFGALAGRSALDSTYLTKVLGRNLIASHSVGVGPYFEEAVVRAVLLIRAQSLAQGYSGARPLIIDCLLRMLNERVYPAVPELGSLGASGDLAPLAHLLLVLCGAPDGASRRRRSCNWTPRMAKRSYLVPVRTWRPTVILTSPSNTRRARRQSTGASLGWRPWLPSVGKLSYTPKKR